MSLIAYTRYEPQLFQDLLDSGGQNSKLARKVTDTAQSNVQNTRNQAPIYQWLLFDADGTLFDFERAEGIALRQAFERAGVAFETAYLGAYRKINEALWRAVERGEVLPGTVKVRRFELLLQTLRLNHSPTVFSASYLETLTTCSQLMEDAEATLKNLQKKYQIAILTNGLREVQRGRLARSSIRHHISELIISEEIGFAKPAKEFFDSAFVRLGHPSRNSVLMIGDSWTSDIEGAVQYGIDACWYNPGRQSRPAYPEITREIASLQELTEWLP